MSPKLQDSLPDTRQRLLRVALQAFGHHDFDAVSTREIVRLAGSNISAISYHFGGKKGLYLATAEFLAGVLHGEIEALAEEIGTELPHADRGRCKGLLGRFIQGFTGILLQGEFGEDAPGFIFREQNHPTEAFDILYRRLLQPLHEAIALLVGRIRGLDPAGPECIFVTHALIGQVIAFRVGRTSVMRRLGKQAYSPGDVKQIEQLISAMVMAAIDYRINDSGQEEKR